MADGKTQSQFGIELGQRGGWLINESGLYSLILSSKLPTAKRFKRWVTSEVLPTIRKHGVYAVDEMLANPDVLIVALTELKSEREKSLALLETVAVQKQQIREAVEDLRDYTQFLVKHGYNDRNTLFNLKHDLY